MEDVEQPTRKWYLSRRSFIAAVVLLGLLIRIWAAWQLPLDYDEPVYLAAGTSYARAIQQGDLQGVIDNPLNREHPALIKLLYSLPVLAAGGQGGGANSLFADRMISVAFGTLAVWLLAIVSPLAGLFLAVDTLAVKYTSQAYLEALPHLASLAAILAMTQVKGRRDRWFWLSAAALGVMAASKYSYLPIVGVLGYIVLAEKRTRWVDILLYTGAAFMVFVALDPSIWPDPAGRLAQSLSFHGVYAQGTDVARADYPWYQPLVWISRAVPWHPQVFFYVPLDAAVFILAIPGLYWMWRERRWAVIWLGVGTVTLLAWPVKWPQYALLVIPPLCLSAAASLTRGYRWLQQEEAYYNWLGEMFPKPSKGLMVAAALAVLGLVGAKVGVEIQMAIARQGWALYNTQNSPLPSDWVSSLAPRPDGAMWIGTDHGLVLFQPTTQPDQTDQWKLFTAQNSGLADDRVYALCIDRAGVLWAGTEKGLSRYDGQSWETYRGREIGLSQESVWAVVEGPDGRIWVGGPGGAAGKEGSKWRAFTSENSGLAGEEVFTLAVASRDGREQVWFGTQVGVSSLDLRSGTWTSYNSDNSELGWGGVADLKVDAAGKVWAATLGGGMSAWDGTGWQSYRISNSDIPENSVRREAVVPPGMLWIGTSRPAEPGGVVAVFQDGKWRAYTPLNSGYSGAEPLAITTDSKGRIWIGTRTEGISIFMP